MPHKISYPIPIGPTNDKFGIRESAPSDAILVVDNKDSDFSLATINEGKDTYIPKKIYKIDSLLSSTNIITNTIDTMMSDVFDNGTPLFFKVVKREKYFDSVKINGVVHTVSDSHFIYTNDKSGQVEYLDEKGRIMLIEEAEFYPVFIWEGMINLSDIISKDSRTFSYIQTSLNISISCSKPGVAAEVDSDSIFKLHNDELKYFVKPFLHELVRDVDGQNVRYEYDYSRVIPNIKTVQYENVDIVNRYHIKLKNKRVFKDSLKVSIVSRDTGEEVHVIDNTLGFDNNNIRSDIGLVNIKDFVETYNMDYQDYIFTASYRYLDLSDNEIVVDPKSIDIKFKKILFTISPTRITQGEVVTNFSPEISYTIANLDGSIVSSVSSDVPLYDFTIPVFRGFGEDTYSEHGFSGITDQQSKDFYAVSDASKSGTGYSIGSYSDGPFSGSFIRNLEDISNLLSVQNNALAGQISLAEVELVPKINLSKIYNVNKLTKTKDSEISGLSLDLFGQSAWHLSLSDTFSDIDLAAGITEYKSTTGFFARGYIYKSSTDTIYLNFDISSISDYLDASGEMDTSMVMTDIDALTVFNKYLGINDCSFNKDKLKVFNGLTREIIVDADYKISSDMKSLAVSLPISLKGSIIGLGIDGETTIFPTAWINI